MPADEDRRYPTLARMAAIARKPTSSHPSAEPGPGRIQEEIDLETIGPDEAGRTTSRSQLDLSADTDFLLRKYTLPQPLPEPDLVLPFAVLEAGIAAIAALVGAVLIMAGSSTGFWVLGLCGIAGIGSWLAYLWTGANVAERKRAAAVLLVSQLGILVWSLALLGPMVSQLMLAPILLLLSLRMSSRRAAASGTLIALALYLVFEILALNQWFHPVLQLNNSWLAAVNSTFTTIGIIFLLVAALDLHTSRSRAEHLARARLQELRQVRASASQLRQWTEEEAARLQESLQAAVYGNGDVPSSLEGPLSPLNATIELCSERVASLQRDRDEHLRLQAAVRGLTHAMERAWLGLPWTWPAPSGTVLDQLVALLRTPSPRDVPPESIQDTLTLVPIPSLELAPSPPRWEAPGHHPPTFENRTGSGMPQTPSLPWEEWDKWRTWDDQSGY